MAITLGEPMPNKEQARLTKLLEETTSERYCNTCLVYHKIAGGKWIHSANGLRRKWKCAGCLQRAQERLQTVS